MINYQNKWDKWLLKGWYEFKNFSWVSFKFIQEVAPEELNCYGYLDLVKSKPYFENLNLKRCMSKDDNGYFHFPSYQLEIRAFIFERSPVLSACLVTDKMNRIEILLDIDSFKWDYARERPKDVQRRLARHTYQLKNAQRNVEIKARSLCHKSDWSKVK